MRDAYLPWAYLRLRAKRRAAVSVGTQKPGQEHYAAFKHMTIEGMGPSLTVEGATTARVFETYVEKVLLPSLTKKARSW